MNFLQGDILDKEMVNKNFKDADVVHHLAGITNVPRTQSESVKSHDEKILSVAKDGTKNILDAINKTGIEFYDFCSSTEIKPGIKNIKNEKK